MKQNLDVLKTEIKEYLENRDLGIFYSYSRMLNHLESVMWDIDQHPDYREFVRSAEAAGAKLIAMHVNEFAADFVDNTIEELEEADLLPDERRTLERRLRDMRAYDGFTCEIELSFDLGTRTYVFELRTEWYEEFTDILNEIDLASPGESDGDDDDEGPIGGYFSKN